MNYKPSKNVFLLGVVSFFNDFSSEMIYSVLPGFFVSVLKSGAGALGIVDGFADGLANFVKIYSGRRSDKIKKQKIFIFIGYFFSVITRPFYNFATSVTDVIGLRLIDRTGKGLRDAPRDAIISLSTAKNQVGRAFGFHRTVDSLGGICGPLTAYFIMKNNPEGFGTVFMWSFIIGVLSIFFIFFIKDVVADVKEKNINFSLISSFSSDFKRYILALFFLSLGTIPVTVLLLKTQNLNLAIASIPLFYLAYNLSYNGLSFWAGGLSDKFGPRRIITIGYFVLVVSYFLLFFADKPVTLVLSFLVLGLFQALTDGVQRAYASALSADEYRATAMGIVNAVIGFGLLFAGVVGGYIWQYYGIGFAVASPDSLFWWVFLYLFLIKIITKVISRI